jgi:4-hydroxybenzoate polyprenyltransferase
MSLLRRFWVYQAERFPLAETALLLVALAAGGLGFAHAARRAPGWPQPAAYIVAFVCSLGYFFQLRVADEYKDFADDAAHRPYRPVPRGVISLAELAWLGAGVAVVQAALALWLAPRLALSLLAVWGYMALMRWEFGVHAWLRARPLLYMLSHMVILPLIFVFVTACDWLPAGGMPPRGLAWLLAAGYANGIVFEVGRKLRAPAAEEPGVETYSLLWGIRRATLAWIAALTLAGCCATLAARAAGDGRYIGLLALAGLATASALGLQFVRRPSIAGSKWLERFSALWMLLLYTALALLPIGES